MTDRVISTILRHDRKVNSYKIALLRALNDVVLAYPDLRQNDNPIAVPLRLLAESWVAYYWPFVAPDTQVRQGPMARRDGRHRNDMGFRPQLHDLRRAWEAIHGPSGPSGGWLLVEHMRVPRSRVTYDPRFRKAYQATLNTIRTSLRQPLQYAGPGQWSVFDKPVRARDLPSALHVPGTDPNESVTLIDAGLWQAFRDVSL